jgi:4-hydroxybenzoate polyprenyltransferase
MTDPTRPSSVASDILQSLRPNQWTKNAVVFAAFIFAMGDRTQAVAWPLLIPTALAAALFCVVSSGIYVMNDILDRDLDRLHPIKNGRPIPAGRIPLPAAWGLSLTFLLLGFAGAWWLSKPFAGVVACYVLLQGFYNLWLRRVALMDVFIIAAGFVLRALGGGVVIGIPISPWLILCTLLLALFLALCKRRHEKILLDDSASEHRAALEHYDRQLLDQLIAVVSASTIVSYSIYTLSPETVRKFGSARLGFSIPFVLFGIFRYLDLVYRKDKGGHPEKVLLTDGPLLIDLGLYGLTVLGIFALRRWGV